MESHLRSLHSVDHRGLRPQCLEQYSFVSLHCKLLVGRILLGYLDLLWPA